MTTEEKALAYDKAIKFAKIYYNSGDENMRIMMETCFPELKESEDERTRKELIDFVKSRLAGFPQCDRFIAWLEKQKPVEYVKDE